MTGNIQHLMLDIVFLDGKVMNSSRIGVFDSGLGGLTVWREIRRQMPNEDILYFADSKNCPYGPKPPQTIAKLACEIVDGMIASGCKMVVVACNTATAAAIDTLRQNYSIPFVGMEPAIKQAALNTKTGKVGVLATKGTFDGRLYKETSRKYANNIDVMVQIGTGLVELVETDEYNTEKAHSLLEKYVTPMIEHGVDQIVLGCTHYPFFKPQIEQMVGSGVAVIDPAPAVARQASKMLSANNLQNNSNHIGTDLFVSSGKTEAMRKLLTSMTGKTYAESEVEFGGERFEALSVG